MQHSARIAPAAAPPALAAQARAAAPSAPLAAAGPAAPVAAVPSPVVPSPVVADAGWSWSPSATDSAARPLPDGWLQALASATPSWQESPAGPGDWADARSLSLWRRGVPEARLQLGRDRVQWCSAATGCRVAAIDAAAASALRAALGP